MMCVQAVDFRGAGAFELSQAIFLAFIFSISFATNIDPCANGFGIASCS